MFTVTPAVALYRIELYGKWYTLADFFPNWNFRGVFSIYHRITLISQDTPRYCDFSRFFPIFYSPESQRSCDVRGGGRGTLYFIASVGEGL
jgi:hypothetical protein